MTRQISLSIDRPISLSMRFRMWLHFLICAWCERYRQHLHFLHRAAPNLSDHVDESVPRGLSEAVRSRLKERLRHGG